MFTNKFIIINIIPKFILLKKCITQRIFFKFFFHLIGFRLYFYLFIWSNFKIEWIHFKSFGSGWSFKLARFRKNNLSLFFGIIISILDVIFQVYHVSSTNIDESELILKARLDIFISLCNNYEFVNASVVIHKVWGQFAICFFYSENPFSKTSFLINLSNIFVPWICMCIVSNFLI